MIIANMAILRRNVKVFLYDQCVIKTIPSHCTNVVNPTFQVLNERFPSNNNNNKKHVHQTHVR